MARRQSRSRAMPLEKVAKDSDKFLAGSWRPSLPSTTSQGTSRLNCPAAGYQVDDGDDYRQDQKQMDQASSNMKTPSQQPQNQQNGKNCPKHRLSPQGQKTGTRTRNHNATLELYVTLPTSDAHGWSACSRSFPNA